MGSLVKKAVANVPALIAVGVAGVLVIGAYLFAGGRNDATAEGINLSRQEVEQIVREYLLANPELLLEVMDKLEERREAARVAHAADGIAANRDALLNDGFSYVGGNPDGDVTIVEFFDYNCTYCRRALPEVLRVLAADPNVRLVLKEYPVLGDDSVIASNYAMAALAQGPDKYLALHEALLSSEEKLDETKVLVIAGEVGLDVERLKRDVQDPLVAERIGKTRDLGQAIGVGGTPTFVIGSQVFPGYVKAEDLLEAIAAAREGRP